MSESLDDLRIEFDCVKCGQRIVVPVRWMGRLVRCSHCQAANRVGRPGEQAAESDDALRLPARVAHAKYLDEMERKVTGNTGQLPQRRRKWGWNVWLLIAVNVLVALGAMVWIVMKIVGNGGN